MNLPRTALPLLLALAGAGIATPGRTRADTTADTAQDKDQCARNLRRVYEAIQAYRVAHKDLPKWLSDLVPDYLASPDALKCPVTRRTGKAVDSWLADPRVYGTYQYEFCDAELSKGEEGPKVRMRDWKRRQMGLIGSAVPMVRCRLHTPVLNLSFGGKVYESQETWELLFADVVNTLDLMPSRLFGQEADKWALGLDTPPQGGPPRLIETRQTPIPLAGHHNALLTIVWLPKAEPDLPRLDLADLPQKLQTLSGVTFDIRGVVQLTGRRLRDAGALFPEVVQDIPVDLKCEQLHFLHAASGSAPEGAPIGFYRLNYADGRTHDLPILYGKHLRDWCAGSATAGLDTNTAVAWAAPDAKPASGRTLFRATWEHPWPDVQIKTIDFASNLTDAAPFLIAITAEKLDLRFGARRSPPPSDLEPVNHTERLSAKGD